MWIGCSRTRVEIPPGSVSIKSKISVKEYRNDSKAAAKQTVLSILLQTDGHFAEFHLPVNVRLVLDNVEKVRGTKLAVIFNSKIGENVELTDRDFTQTIQNEKIVIEFSTAKLGSYTVVRKTE